MIILNGDPSPLLALNKTYWRFHPGSLRYYITKEGAAALGVKAGTFVGAARVASIRDQLIDARKARVTALSLDYAQSGKTPADLTKWAEGMRDEIRSVTIAQYLLARGGREAMTPSDWGRIGGLIANQYKYLNGFIERIDNGRYSDKQIALIARMYAASSVRAFELGKVNQQGIGDLPAMPGDGGTICLSNCRCRWRIVEKRSVWECYWTLGSSEHCQDCTDRARLYSPLIIPKPIEMRLK